jgi:diaminopimelate epimerase
MVPGSKLHAYGNDFLVIDSRHIPESQQAGFSQKACNSHFGVGADGCVILKKISSQHFIAKIFNLDGSEAGMSGNGLRCAAAFLHRRRLTDSAQLRFQTASGAKSYHLLESRPPVWTYLSDIGVPSFKPAKIPIDPSLGSRVGDQYELSIGASTVAVFPLSVGNPQCVVFCPELPERAEFAEVGGALERHAFFPSRTNVSFVHVLGPCEIEIRIWERGVGPTHSSGTGSSGAAVAALMAAKVTSPVEVRTETGTQVVEWEPGGPVKLTGEAEFIADFDFHWNG